MALTQCPECGNQVSTAAAACPKCGAPRQAPQQILLKEARKGTSPWTIIGWIILLILMLPLVTCVMVIGNSGVSDYENRLEEKRQSQ